MKRKRLLPDKRLDWRDPNMPVLDDGIAKTPEKFAWERTRSFVAADGVIGRRHFPDWKNDPSYFWGKKKK